jgi:hypothetical protein
VSCTIPSAAPSSASQRERICAATVPSTSGVNTSRGSCPGAPAPKSARVSHAWASAALGRFIPGADAMIPSNSSAKRVAATSAWRPPLEQPTKYERSGAEPYSARISALATVVVRPTAP